MVVTVNLLDILRQALKKLTHICDTQFGSYFETDVHLQVCPLSQTAIDILRHKSL